MIGVPARNEAERIGELVERVELGTVSLPGDVHSELVLAYQQSDDDTLERFTARPARLPHEVVCAPPGVLGKGANIKLLLRHACDRGVDQVLLVDADLQSYAPQNVRRTLDAARRGRHGLVLPLWCRPRAGQYDELPRESAAVRNASCPHPTTDRRPHAAPPVVRRAARHRLAAR